MSNEFWNEQYELQGESAFFWWLQARRLKRGADLNWEVYEREIAYFKANPIGYDKRKAEDGQSNVDIELSKVYFFLLGLAVENIAKGILIGRDPKYFSHNKTMTHEIHDYVAECKIDLDEKKRKLLEELSIIVKWRGRYPTPKKRKDWALRNGPEGKNTMPGSISPNDKQDLEKIYEDLESTLRREDSERVAKQRT